MKKKFAILLVAIFVLMMFTACGSTENTEQSGNKVSDEKQEEISEIDEPLQEEPTATPTPTLSPTPTPEAIQPGRLLLGLSQNMKEYGSAEIDMSVVVDVNLSENGREEMKASGYFDGVEIEDEVSYRMKGNVASNKDGASANLLITENYYGLKDDTIFAEYMQRNADGDLLDYYLSVEDIWCVYSQGDTTTPDLTDWLELLGVAQVSQLTVVNVFENLALTEEGDQYLVDGMISFDRFMKITEIGDSFYANELAAVSGDLEVNVHAEFGKADKKIRLLSMYLANPKEMTQNDKLQFSELYCNVRFNISPDGERIVVPMDIVNSAVNVD